MNNESIFDEFSDNFDRTWIGEKPDMFNWNTQIIQFQKETEETDHKENEKEAIKMNGINNV